MSGSWLMLPILFPLLGGLGVLRIHAVKPRRLAVFLLLAVQLVLVLALSGRAEEPYTVLTLAGGVRLVLGADALGRLLPLNTWITKATGSGFSGFT